MESKVMDALQQGSRAPLGLRYVETWLTESYASKVVAELDSLHWGNELTRRTQHYGARYVYTSGTLDTAPAMPPRVQRIADSLYKDLGTRYTQCIANEYTSGQGIGAHVDSSVFGDSIATVSLLDTCALTMRHRGEVYVQTLEPRSLLVLDGSARWAWTHCIEPRATRFPGYRRISLTYRVLAA